ncbi:MAG: DEAD/DEAH box helicase [Chitinophagales bacterium]
MLFTDLQLIEPVLKALQQEGYTQPTPVQEQAIPIALQQKDLLACAQTGTGKTAAFAIPIIQLLHQQHDRSQRRKIRALILTPTRELAIQIGESFAAYGRFTQLQHTVIFGGVSQHAQVQKIRHGVDILVATPGRLLDLMQQGFIHLEHLQTFVLDEADRMLDMGFIHDVKRIVAKLPQKKQTLFFSATMPREISALADSLLVRPEKIAVTPVSSTVDLIEQSVYFVHKQYKRQLLMHVLQQESAKTVLLFTRTKHGADKVTRDLNKKGIRSEAIHGNKSQNNRQSALQNFKNGRTRVLVATDIAARGIDVEDLGLVINYELPNIPETYVHRIGRTGRAGAQGKAIAFCDGEEKAYLKDIQKLIGKQITVRTDHPEYKAEVKVSTFTDTADIPASSAKPFNEQRNNSFRRKGGNRFNERRKRA